MVAVDTSPFRSFMAAYRRTFPPEIWSQVLENVPEIQLPNLLGVCSLFHDVVIRTIFASIKVYFFGGKRAMEVLNTFDMDWTTETATKLISKSWEILNRICRDPHFAKVVKSITIVAFTDGLGMLERCKAILTCGMEFLLNIVLVTVANVLSFVPNLQAFRWIGDCPPFDDVVARCLPTTLRGLVLQSP
jgi:hypothetical protein